MLELFHRVENVSHVKNMDKEIKMGGGGYFEGGMIDLGKLTQSAADSIKQIVGSGVRVVFVCEDPDRRTLQTMIKNSEVFSASSFFVLEGGLDEFIKQLASVSTVLVFTHQAAAHPLLNSVAEVTLASKKFGIHVKTSIDSPIPANVFANRWPSVVWDKAEVMFK